MLSKEVSSTIFKVFGMMQPRIEPRSVKVAEEEKKGVGKEYLLDFNFISGFNKHSEGGENSS